MLDYTLTEEQEMIRTLARDFARQEIVPHAARWAERRPVPECNRRRPP